MYVLPLLRLSLLRPQRPAPRPPLRTFKIIPSSLESKFIVVIVVEIGGSTQLAWASAARCSSSTQLEITLPERNEL